MTEARVTLTVTSGFQQKKEKMKMNQKGNNLNRLACRLLTKSIWFKPLSIQSYNKTSKAYHID